MEIARSIVGIDTGGTFTDCFALLESGEVLYAKYPTTYDDFSKAVFRCLNEISMNAKASLEELLRNSLLYYGTTIATNTLFTRSGVKTGLITTKGFEDIPLMMRGTGKVAGLSEEEIKRQTRTRKPEPIIPRKLIKGVVERIDSQGEVVVPLDFSEVESVVNDLISAGVESIAVCMLNSPVNPRHEIAVGEYIKRKYPAVHVSLSHRISQVIGEYPRMMATIINAYVEPIVRNHLQSLERELKSKGYNRDLYVTTIYGSVLPAHSINSIETVESGPAMGIVGSAFFSSMLGIDNVIATDVGGTTFKVGLIHNGEWSYIREPMLERFQIAIPMIDVFSISAGGGTVVWVDPVTNLIKIGPKSAGSEPGPVCYDRGGKEPTVTDACLILGYINPDYFLKGRMKLNQERALEIFRDKIADPMGMDVVEAAHEAVRIMVSQCADAIRLNTVMRGFDPAEFAILAYGGAGGLFSAQYAQELGIERVYIPHLAPVFEAMSIIASDVRRIYRHPYMRIMPVDAGELSEEFLKLEELALNDMEKMGFNPAKVALMRWMELRYSKQINVERVGVKRGKLDDRDVQRIMDDFDRIYEESYGKGTAYRKAGIESVNLIVEAVYQVPKIRFKTQEFDGEDASKALRGKREVFIDGDYSLANVYDGARLKAGNVVFGPAIIEYPATTVVVPEDRLARIDEYLNVVIQADSR